MKSTLTSRGTWLLGAALVFAQDAAQACPGCKPVDGAPLSGASVGFGWDIVLMLLTIGSLLGGFSYMIYQSCRALAERDRLLDARETA
jgi:argininosuccinate lyase